MVVLVLLVSVLGVLSGRWSHQRWGRVTGAILLVGCAPFAAWAVMEVVGNLIAGLASVFPEAAGGRPVEVTVAVASSLPLLGLVSGRRWNEHRRLRRLRVGTEMSAAALVFQIDALAQVPGVSEHSWLTNRWTSMSRAERLGWVSRRTNALATLHREAGGLGLARLGRRAADRLEQLDRLQT